LAKKKKAIRRAWTSSDVRELKSLAKKKAGVGKISKALKRTIGATAAKAHQLAACRTDVFAALSSKVRMPSAICKLAARRLVPGAEAILGVLKSAVCSMAG
jgi:hypothetical protein